jgi:hypothetical protein
MTILAPTRRRQTFTPLLCPGIVLRQVYELVEGLRPSRRIVRRLREFLRQGLH